MAPKCFQIFQASFKRFNLWDPDEPLETARWFLVFSSLQPLDSLEFTVTTGVKPWNFSILKALNLRQLSMRCFFNFPDFKISPRMKSCTLPGAGHDLLPCRACRNKDGAAAWVIFPGWSRLWWFLQICFSLKENWKKKTFGSDSSICWFADQRPEKWLRCISSLERSIRLALGKGHARNRRLPTFLGHNRSQNSHPKRGVWLGNLQTCHGQTIKPVIGWCSRISPNIPRYLTSRYLI